MIQSPSPSPPPQSPSLEQPILRTRLGGIPLRALPALIPTLPRRLEEQTRAISLSQRVAQVTPMRRVAVVLDILPARRIREAVLVLGSDLAENGGEGLFAVLLCGGSRKSAKDGAGDEVRGGGGGAGDQGGGRVERDDRVAVAA